MKRGSGTLQAPYYTIIEELKYLKKDLKYQHLRMAAMDELWRDVKGYEGLYQVSNLGNVRHIKKDKARKLRPNNRGYIQVHFYKAGKYKKLLVHRLVAIAFIPNPLSKSSVNHINGDKTDNRVVNLEWCTVVENIHHAIETGLRNNTGANNPQSKPLINCRGQVFSTGSEAAAKFGIKSSSNITKACRGVIHYSGHYEDGTPIKWAYKE